MVINYIIVSGNPVDGYKFVGPFETEQAALNYAAINYDPILEPSTIALLTK